MNDLLTRRRRVLPPCVGNFFGDDPVTLVRGSGTHVWDDHGREYLDFFAGVAVTGLGHCHPEVVEAATRQLATLQHTTTIHLTEPMVRLAEGLVRVQGGGLRRVFFCADGSGANEGALVAARIATGRPGLLAFDCGLHGRTSLTMAATGLGMWRADPFAPGDVVHVAHPAVVGSEESLSQVREAIMKHGMMQFAAFIAEPVCGNGGILVPPAGFFQELKALLRANGILLVADEVQTGLCRTGRWFALEHWDTTPDLMSLAKALGNGLPIAAWMGTEEVASRLVTPQASTFGGNLVPVAAALKVIEVMERDGIASRASAMGARLLAGLRAVASQSEAALEARGLGLMVGVELVDADGEPDGQACDRALLSLREQGILAGKTGRGRNVLAFEPPLIVTEAEVDRVVEATAEALCLAVGQQA